MLPDTINNVAHSHELGAHNSHIAMKEHGLQNKHDEPRASRRRRLRSSPVEVLRDDLEFLWGTGRIGSEGDIFEIPDFLDGCLHIVGGLRLL